MQCNEWRHARLLRSQRGVRWRTCTTATANTPSNPLLLLLPIDYLNSIATMNVTEFGEYKNRHLEFTALSRPRCGQHAASAQFGGPEPPARAHVHSSGSNPLLIARGSSIIASFSIRPLRPLARFFRRSVVSGACQQRSTVASQYRRLKRQRETRGPAWATTHLLATLEPQFTRDVSGPWMLSLPHEGECGAGPKCRPCVAFPRSSPNAAAAGDSCQRQVPIALDRTGSGLGEVLMPLVSTLVS